MKRRVNAKKKNKRDSENKGKMTFKLSRQDASLSQDVGCTNYYLLIDILMFPTQFVVAHF